MVNFHGIYGNNYCKDYHCSESDREGDNVARAGLRFECTGSKASGFPGLFQLLSVGLVHGAYIIFSFFVW